MENQEKIQIEYVKVSDLIPYDKNPRKNDPAVDAVAASIRSFGFKIPVVIDENSVLVCGHTRVKAAKKLGMDEIPCVRATDLTPEQIRAFRIADNKVSELAEWDDELLKLEISDLPEFDFEQFGFDMDYFTNVEQEGMTDPDQIPEREDEAVPKSRSGELYVLGEHLLMCGDSTKSGDVEKLVGREESDLWLTDPPYNVAYEGSNGLTIKNDSMPSERFYAFLRDAFKCAVAAMKPGAAYYIFHADNEGLNFRKACEDNGLKIRECLIWKKNALVLGRQDYQHIHEPCLYGWKDGAGHHFIDKRTITTVLGDDIPDFDAMKKEDLLKIVKTAYSNILAKTIIECPKPTRNAEHPTMKPIRLLNELIENSSKPGWVVLDTFGGSGSTLIACQQMGRACRTMELDPKYCDVIRKRWAEFVHGEGCDWERLTPTKP